VLEVGKFRVRGRHVWIGVVFSGAGKAPIQAIAFSFDRESMLQGIWRNTRTLTRRGVNVDIQTSYNKKKWTTLVRDVMIGRVSNEVALESLSFRGLTPFERNVYEYLTKSVKRGSVITYGELARRLGTSARAIGGAMRRNPYPIVVPCHRVISKEGLGGYTPSIDHKRFLLTLEKEGEG